MLPTWHTTSVAKVAENARNDHDTTIPGSSKKSFVVLRRSLGGVGGKPFRVVAGKRR